MAARTRHLNVHHPKSSGKKGEVNGEFSPKHISRATWRVREPFPQGRRGHGYLVTTAG